MNFEYNPNESSEESKEKEMGSFGIDKEVEKSIIEKMDNGFDERAIAIAKENGVSEEILREIAKQDIFYNFEKRHHKDTIHLIDIYNIDKNLLNNEEFVKLGKERVVLKLSQGDIIAAREVLKDLNIDEKYLETEEAKESAKKGIKNILSLDKIDEVVNIKNIFNIDNAFMDEAIREEIEIRLKDNLIVGADVLQKRFDISKDFMKEAVEKEVLSRLSSGNSLEGIAHFITNMEMDASFLTNEKIKEAIGKRIKSMIGSHGQEKIPDIFKKV
jgi:RNA-binding protein YhbY